MLSQMLSPALSRAPLTLPAAGHSVASWVAECQAQNPKNFCRHVAGTERPRPGHGAAGKQQPSW